MIKLIKTNYYREKSTSKKIADFIEQAKQLSFGEQCILFEHNFAEYQQRRHSIFLNSGSSANLAVIQALLNLGKIKRGDKVGFSALTWSTNVMPIIELGLDAVPIDIEIDTLNVSSRTLINTITKHDLKILFITNLLGWCDDLEEIAKICRSKRIILIEDNCESLGSVYKGKKLGNFGFASTFSFYVGHHMSTIEGGAVCTNNEELATMVRLVRAHGWDRNLAIEKQEKIRKKFKVNSTFYSRYTFYDLGYNLRPTEINGYLGNIQLKYLDEINQRRNSNYLYMAPKIYTQSEKYYRQSIDHMDFFSNFAIPVICKSVSLRDELVKKCSDVLEIRPVVGGDMTKQPFFKKYMQKYAKDFKNSNAALIHRQGLYFGNNPELTKKEMNQIISLFVD